jgi:hypothetical protein
VRGHEAEYERGLHRVPGRGGKNERIDEDREQGRPQAEIAILAIVGCESR